jgi:hypothetical protein
MPNVNPSRIRIAKICSVSESTVKRSFSELESKNLIYRSFQTGKRSRYLLHKDHDSFIGKKLSTTSTKGGSPMTQVGGSNEAKRGFTHDPTGGSPMHPKQYKEQYKKQEKQLSNESIEERKEFIKSLMKSV